ncbi:MAG: CoA pyrophosphatase [Legionella sp.]|nr:MAG: CoA pyrophosphatase [Legionella sp.]
MDLKDNKQGLSAVIVLHELNTDHLILTKRNAQLRNHPGEISFPGGQWEEGDKDLYTTALRELFEELGIRAERVQLLQELQKEQTRLGSIIQPWFATIDNINPYVLNQNEVERLVLVPMSAIKNLENYRDVSIERMGYRFTSCQFTASDEFIWGATARIMKQLVS